ncbi:centrosomal protein of 55 kDa isoform X4 [Ambystoma mexicanum]|uniref:centrosomal protein of 55 kDa isoform X4 n=1 Tax=Ambystoma mexicanum TaxID=8296 RepID=UPI0037E7BE94
MTAKTAKDLITNKLGFKAVVSKSDTDLEKLKKENSALKKAVEEISKGKGKLTDMERSQLLEKILALETEKEKHNQQLSEKNQEILHLKDKLRAKYHGDASHGQLAAKAKEAERREQLYKSLSEETDSLKKQLYTVTAKCVELENKAIACQISQESGTSQLVHLKDQNPVESQLKDALEKNQQWLVYDQQREVYVKGLVSRIYDLEQQLGTMNQTVQQKAKDGHLEGPQEEEKQKYYDRLLITAKNDLDAEKKRSAQLGFDHTELKKKYDEKKKEMMDVSNTLLSQIAEEQQQRENEKRRMGDKIQKLKTEVELTKQKYEDEKKRSDDLSSRVDLLQNTVLKHQEENRRISFLEQQKQMHEFHYTESSNDFHTEFDDRLKICNQNQSPKRSSLLNESFLECPKCKAQYPTSQHRELLTHIDFCPDI